VDAAFAAELTDGLTINDAELKAELIAHFLLPLELQRRRADDQNRPHAVTENHLLYDKAGLDGLAEPNIIGYP
jgi:hypothetical protein